MSSEDIWIIIATIITWLFIAVVVSSTIKGLTMVFD